MSMKSDLLTYIAVVLTVFIILGVLHLLLGPQNEHCVNLSYLPCASDSHTP